MAIEVLSIARIEKFGSNALFLDLYSVELNAASATEDYAVALTQESKINSHRDSKHSQVSELPEQRLDLKAT